MKFFDIFTTLSILFLSASSFFAQDCDVFTQNNLLRTTENCQSGIFECLPIDFEYVDFYEYSLNGNPFSGSFMGCGNETTVSYDVLGIGNYPVHIEGWEVDGIFYSGLEADSPSELASVLSNLSDTNWSFDDMTFKVESTNAPDSLGWLTLREINTGLIAQILPEYSTISTQTAFELPIGNHVFVAYNLLEDCADTLLIDVVCQQITDTLVFNIEIGDLDSLVFDNSNLGMINYFANECQNQSGTFVGFQVFPSTTTLHFAGLAEGTEEACIVICDVNGICDTTYVVVNVSNPPPCIDPVIDFVEVVDKNCEEPGAIEIFMEDPNQSYEWNWDSPQSDDGLLFNLEEGTYNVTITYTDPALESCFTVGSYTVNFLDTIDNYEAEIFPSCDNIDGIVLFNNPSLTYTWEDGFEGSNRFGVIPGVYEVTVSTHNCEEVTIVDMPDLYFDLFGSVANVCDSLGSIYLDVNGGLPPFDYLWSDGVIAENRIGVDVGHYFVTVTDANGCIAENSFEVIDDCPSTTCTTPVITNVTTNDPSCSGSGLIVVELLDNSLDYIFDWAHGGPNSGIQTGLAAGNYMVTISNIDSNTGEICSITSDFILVDSDSLNFFLVNSENATCVDPGIAEYSDPNLNYVWSDGGTGHFRADLLAGNYLITVTTPNGNCSQIESLTIEEEESIFISGFAANVCDTLGSIYLSVTGNFFPFTYQWSNGSMMEDQPELGVGIYSLTVTDSEGCTAVESYEIVDDCIPASCTDPVITDVTIIQPDCLQGGLIDVSVENITPNLTYQWSNGSDMPHQIIDLEPGTYSVTISDFDPQTGDICSVTETYVLTNQDSLGFFLVSSTPADCGSTGSAEYSDPTLNYIWSDGGFGHMRNDLAAGFYDITVTAPGGFCEEVTFLNIQDISSIIITGNAANVCDTLGSIYLAVSGNNPPFTYEWSNFTTTLSQPELDVGVYILTVTDDQGCTAVETYEIVDDCPMTGDLIFTFIPTDEDILCGESAPVVSPIAESDCPGDITYDFSETVTSGSCPNTFTFTRTWTATDDCGNTASAQQFIFQIDIEEPEIVTVGDIFIDLLNGDSLPDPYGLAFAEDDCSGIGDLSFTKQENITTDGYEVIYTWTAIDECGNLSTESHTVDITGGMIWPGDTDSNKVVNNFDVFNIGFAYGATGPTRMNPTLDFLPQYAAPWSENGIDEVNFRHADTDGNGIVDQEDILAVNQNYDLIHNLQLEGDTRESFEIDFVFETISADNWVDVAIMIGNTAEPIDDFYGVGFIIEYDQSMVVENTAHVDFSESWAGTFFTDFMALQKDFHDEGRLDVGLVRIDQEGIDGSGKIGSFRFQLPESVELTPFTLTAREGSGVRSDKSSYELETAEVVITDTKDILESSIIDIYPNPVNTELFLEIPTDLEVTDIQLFGTNGQMVQQYDNVSTRTLEVNHLPAGLYYLRVLTTEGTWSDKVSIMR